MGDVKIGFAGPQGRQTGQASGSFTGFRFQKRRRGWTLQRGLRVFARLASNPAAKNAIELIKYDAGEDRKDQKLKRLHEQNP